MSIIIDKIAIYGLLSIIIDISNGATSTIIDKIDKLVMNIYYNRQMIDHQDISKAVVKQRKLLGLSQHDLAHKAGVSRQLIAKFETGRQPELGIMRLLRILHALQLDLRITSLNRRRPTLEDLRAEEEGETK